MQRLFTTATLAEGEAVAATEAQAHYLAHVMRRQVGDAVALFNGRHGEWRARIATLHRGRAALEVEALLRPQAVSPALWLAFAPLKRDATDLVVRQATELGATALLPVLTARTNAARLNADRLAAIAREAAEQCERLDVPTIAASLALPELLAGWPPERALAAAVERGALASNNERRALASDDGRRALASDDGRRALVPDVEHRAPASGAASRPADGSGGSAAPAGARALLIGPEGGFAPAELDRLRRCAFVSPLDLGPLVLRAETAVVAGLALLQAAAWSSN